MQSNSGSEATMSKWLVEVCDELGPVLFWKIVLYWLIVGCVSEIAFSFRLLRHGSAFGPAANAAVVLGLRLVVFLAMILTFLLARRDVPWKLAKLVATKRTYETIFEPMQAEFDHEYFEALSDQQRARPAWLCVVQFFAFWRAAASLNLLAKLAKQAWEIFRGA